MTLNFLQKKNSKRKVSKVGRHKNQTSFNDARGDISLHLFAFLWQIAMMKRKTHCKSHSKNFVYSLQLRRRLLILLRRSFGRHQNCIFFGYCKTDKFFYYSWKILSLFIWIKKIKNCQEESEVLKLFYLFELWAVHTLPISKKLIFLRFPVPSSKKRNDLESR